jgi:hypothetical protein
VVELPCRVSVAAGACGSDAARARWGCRTAGLHSLVGALQGEPPDAHGVGSVERKGVEDLGMRRGVSESRHRVKVAGVLIEVCFVKQGSRRLREPGPCQPMGF